MDFNKEDGGKRKFIICTNNENQIAEEVCFPRIEKIIKGYTRKSKNSEKIKGLGGNLQYFKTDLIPVERIDNINDKQRHELTEKAGQMIAMKENTFKEVEVTEWYQIFESKDKMRKTAIYFRENADKFEELVKKIKNIKTVLYIFSYGVLDKDLFKYLGKNIKVEDIPEPILEIYKEINLTLKDK
jgi:adenine-specific DNA-methyltransferase